MLFSTVLKVTVNVEFQALQVGQAAWLRTSSENVIPLLSDIPICTVPQYASAMNCPDPCATFDACADMKSVDPGGGILGGLGIGF